MSIGVSRIKDDRALEVPVTTGQKFAGLLEITGGLKEGDKVVANVDAQLKAGAKVTQKIK